jgi:hypothetical protein
MPVRPDLKNPYDANSAKFTIREKSVTSKRKTVFLSHLKASSPTWALNWALCKRRFLDMGLG